MRNLVCIGWAAAAMMVGGHTMAKVTEAEAARLDADLTPLGAEREGNAAGTIPPWTGGLHQAPDGWSQDERVVNPFPDDKPLFTITADNYEQYRDNLTDGHIAMFNTYPDYTMPVYQTRRTAAYPERIYDKLKQNAVTAELLDNGNGVRDTIATSPFPIPQNGLEAIWNHILRFRGNQVEYRTAFATPSVDGAFTPVLTDFSYYFAYAEPGVELADIDNKIFYLLTEIISPPKLAGTITLVHETLDQVRSPRLAWRYEAGSRRLRRSPNLAYETDLPNSSSLRSVDQKDLYNGAPNQYDWNLLGKREIYVPYNAYELHSDDHSNSDVIRAGHINQDLTRYELHRVWVLEAKVRTGISHIYPHRKFYIDEDSWQILATEEYDHDDNLWRVSEAHNLSFYNVPVFWTTLETTYDLKSKRYYVDGLHEGQGPFDFDPGFRRNEFSASAARRAARR